MKKIFLVALLAICFMPLNGTEPTRDHYLNYTIDRHCKKCNQERILRVIWRFSDGAWQVECITCLKQEILKAEELSYSELSPAMGEYDHN